MQLLIINSRGSEDGLPELLDGVTLPVLQDTADDGAFTAWGAEKWYLYYLDRQGRVRFIHYELSFPSDEARLVSRVETLRAE